jgi:O-antigen ligase
MARQYTLAAVVRLAARALLLACLFTLALTPLIITPFLVYPFITGKAWFFRVLTDAAWLLFLLLGYRPAWSRLAIVFSSVLILAFISDVRADIPWLAFISSAERMGGWLNLLHLYLLFLIAGVVLDTPILRRRWIATFVLTSVLVALIGFLQFILFVAEGAARSQITSTFGNPSFLGQYAMLMFFLAALLTLGKAAWTSGGRGTSGTPRSSWLFTLLSWPLSGLYGSAWRSLSKSAAKISLSPLWAAVAFLNLCMVFLAQSRGAVIGLLAGGVIALPGRWRALVLALLALLTVVAMTVHDPRPGAGRLLPLAERFAELQPDDPRLAAWSGAIRGARERPLLGWGEESFREVAYIYCKPCGTWWDRGHNLLIDKLVEGGIMGLLAWLWLLWAAREGVILNFQGASRRCLLGFLTAYFVSDMFLFDTMASYLPLMLVMVLATPVKDQAWTNV